MTAQQFYQSYLADDSLSQLSETLVDAILKYYPTSVLDFGCGTGKHLALINQHRPACQTLGIDVSLLNVIYAKAKNNLDYIAIGNESLLKHLHSFDVITTCSVLDHVKDIDGIVDSFKQIAKRAIVIAETNDTPGEFYYPHDYEKLGFQKMAYEWKSPGDGATYHIWIWHNTKFIDHEDFPTI